MLHLGDAGEIIFVGVVDRPHRLHLLLVALHQAEAQRTIGQRPVRIVEIFVDRAGIDHLRRGVALGHVLVGGVGLHRDQRVIEDAAEHRRIALRRHRLVAILEIAAVAAGIDRHARRHLRIELLGRKLPLLDRVVLEHLLVDILGQELQLVVLAAAQLQDRHLLAEAVHLDQLARDRIGQVRREGALDRIEVERQRQRIAFHHPQHAMVIGPPAGEAREVAPHLLAVGVEDVGAILVHQDAVAAGVIVGVARDMVAPVDQQHALAELARDPLRHDCAGEPRANDQPVIIRHAQSDRPTPLKIGLKRRAAAGNHMV